MSFKYDTNLPDNIPAGQTYQSKPEDMIDLPYKQNSMEGNAAQWLVKYFKQSIGRMPTQDEISQFLPTYVGADKNITDVAQGNAAVARYHQQMNPNAQLEKEAPGQYDAVNALFKQNLGREATDDEKNHFGTLLASKQYDAYTISQFLQTLPENVKKQDKAFQDELSGTLQKQDAQYYNEQIMPGIEHSFAKAGRSFDSSGYAQALAQAAQGQNRQREGFLSNLTAAQYGNSQANARADYLGNYSYLRDRSNQLQDQNTSRLYELENFNIQKRSYDDYLKRYGKRSSGFGSMGSLAGMGIGAALAAPTGGMSIPMGAMLGSAIGGGGGSLFDSYGG